MNIFDDISNQLGMPPYYSPTCVSSSRKRSALNTRRGRYLKPARSSVTRVFILHVRELSSRQPESLRLAIRFRIRRWILEDEAAHRPPLEIKLPSYFRIDLPNYGS